MSEVFSYHGDIANSKELAPVREELSGADGVVLINIDEIVYSEDYNPDDLKFAISRLQDKGVLVGIYSDFPQETCVQFADQLEVNGPLIYEMAGVHFPKGFNKSMENSVDIADPEAAEYFDWLRCNAYRCLFSVVKRQTCIFSKYHDHEKEIRDGTIYRYYKEDIIKDGGIDETIYRYPHVDGGVWFDPDRRHSFKLWASGIDYKGELCINHEFRQKIDEIDKVVRDLIGEKMEELDYNYDPENGVIIVKFPDKTKPITQGLLPFLRDTAFVYMIGDLPQDFIDDPRVITSADKSQEQRSRDFVNDQDIIGQMNEIADTLE